ncbi:MAG: PilZ domain-containing protein [Spirochaetales bacterium]|uniref:PilZ domain-containing protein n=1 Tax=Candidatus Thalassospirochaeta sargassi TaxID=3119039 RepID=A0AAJ1IDQ2_9SPIO|nr:PilZ domain-containing protein [Spirochaetales bacterium]
MGSTISRIEREFIIKALDENKFALRMHGNRVEAEVVILNFEDEEYIEVFSKDRALGEFEKGEKIRLFFSYYGHIMTFNTKILSCDEEKAKLEYPERVLKNLQRKYERVEPPSGVDLMFTVDNVKVELKFPESGQFVRLEDFTYSDTFDTSSLDKLITDFRVIISNHCDKNRIVMFRDREPDSFEEKLVAENGRVFFLQSIYEGMTVPDTEEEIDIIEKSELKPEDIETLLADMKKQGVYSVLYCPILYHEYTAGYIFLCNERNKKIEIDTLEYVYQFSKILAWSLDKNNYFSGGQTKAQDFNSSIIDISASGLMFADSSEGLSDVLNIYTDLNLELRIGQRRMVIFSRVMRKFHNKGTTFYGVQFMDINPEDFRYLFEYVYGRVFTEEDSSLWEGGSRPPTLEL